MATVGTNANAPSVLIASNFANDTGYAWTFIFSLQSVVARVLSQRGIGVCLSFAQINGPVTTIDPGIPFQVFKFDPLNITLLSVLQLLGHLRRHRILFVYLTDMPDLALVVRTHAARRCAAHY